MNNDQLAWGNVRMAETDMNEYGGIIYSTDDEWIAFTPLEYGIIDQDMPAAFEQLDSVIMQAMLPKGMWSADSPSERRGYAMRSAAKFSVSNSARALLK